VDISALKMINGKMINGKNNQTKAEMTCPRKINNEAEVGCTAGVCN